VTRARDVLTRLRFRWSLCRKNGHRDPDGWGYCVTCGKDLHRQ